MAKRRKKRRGKGCQVAASCWRTPKGKLTRCKAWQKSCKKKSATDKSIARARKKGKLSPAVVGPRSPRRWRAGSVAPAFGPYGTYAQPPAPPRPYSGTYESGGLGNYGGRMWRSMRRGRWGR